MAKYSRFKDRRKIHPLRDKSHTLHRKRVRKWRANHKGKAYKKIDGRYMWVEAKECKKVDGKYVWITPTEYEAIESERKMR